MHLVSQQVYYKMFHAKCTIFNQVLSLKQFSGKVSPESTKTWRVPRLPRI